MGRYIGPKCKLCRREGEKLFLKGDRCQTAKCAIVKRKYPPGIHGPGQSRGVRLTEYGQQLRAKQSAKRIYGIYEAQFLAYYTEALRLKGDTGSMLLQLLETRLDNLVYRAGWAESRDHARQMVNHGFFSVNGRKTDVPSYQVRVGDVIAIKESKKDSQLAKAIKEKGKPKELPSWLLVEPDKLSVKVLNAPMQDDFTENIDVRLIVEFYSRK